MTSSPLLYILRHGETSWNVTGRLQGRHDAPLTAKGVMQAKAQREILSRCDLEGFTVISSPQGRAQATARLALEGLVDHFDTDDALAEIGLGEWAGAVRQDVMAESGAKDGFEIYELAPGGEGFAALRTRCEGFIARLAGPAVLITHGITSRMLRLVLTGRPVDDLRRIGGGQGVVYHVENGVQRRLSEGA